MGNYASETMNAPDSVVEQTNPHRVLQDISDIDADIAERKARRRQLVELYQQLMVGYEKHYNEVMNRPELAEAPMDMPMRGGLSGY